MTQQYGINLEPNHIGYTLINPPRRLHANTVRRSSQRARTGARDNEIDDECTESANAKGEKIHDLQRHLVKNKLDRKQMQSQLQRSAAKAQDLQKSLMKRPRHTRRASRSSRPRTRSWRGTAK